MATSITATCHIGSAQAVVELMRQEIVDLRTKLAASVVDITALRATVAALQVDSAAWRTPLAAIKVDLDAAKVTYDAHTHTADGNASRTSLPDTGSPTGSPSAASALTITAAAPAAATASAPSTVTATAPTAALIAA